MVESSCGEELPYANGIYQPSDPPVMIAVGGQEQIVYQKVFREIHDHLRVVQPGLLVMGSKNPPVGKRRRESMFEKDEAYQNLRALHLVQCVIGRATGPPSLRFPPSERRFDRAMYEVFEYQEVSPASFARSGNEAGLLQACREGLESVLNEDGQFVSQTYGRSSMVVASPCSSSLVREALGAGVLVGISFANQTLFRFARAVYDHVSENAGLDRKELEAFEYRFDAEDWPAIKQERLDEWRSYGLVSCSGSDIN